MNNFFAELFEIFVFDNKFSERVWDANDYQLIGIAIFIIPFLVLPLFYRLLDPQPVKTWKWIVTAIFSLILVFGFSYYWLSRNSMYEPIMNSDASAMTADSFTLQISLIGSLFSIIPLVLLSWMWSRTISINNAKNPF